MGSIVSALSALTSMSTSSARPGTSWSIDAMGSECSREGAACTKDLGPHGRRSAGRDMPVWRP